jgi:hypothetical protein
MPKTKHPIPKEGIDLPGPIDWEDASHWVEYNNRNRTVVTWCRIGPNRQFKLQVRIRPMVGSEIIHSKLRGHSREEVLRAYGVELSELIRPLKPPKPRGLWQQFKHICKKWF